MSSSSKRASPIYKKKKGGLLPLPPRRKFRKSPPAMTPSRAMDKTEIAQPPDHKYALGEIVHIYFDDRATKIVGVRPWKYTGPLTKVSTEGKIIQASTEKATVAYTKPSGSFSARLKGATPMSVNGYQPLFALMNSDFIADDVQTYATKSNRKVGDLITVYLDPISGQPVEEKTIYSVQGRITKPGTVEIPKTTIKTVVVKGSLPLGKRIELFVNGEKTSLKKMSEASVRVPGTVVDTKDGVSTVSYKILSRKSGQYMPRYSPTNVTGAIVTDPRFVRQISPDQQRAIAAFKPPVPPLCVAETFDPRASNNCFVKGMEKRLEPVKQLKRKYKGTAGGNEFCDFSNPKIQAHQLAVFEYARILASRSPKEIGGIRGMLCYHSTGSGKTVTSLGIILAFWKTKRNIILTTTPENMRGNSPSKYTENLFKFYPEYVKMVYKDKPLPEFTRPPFNRKVQYKGVTMTAEDALQNWTNEPENVRPMTKRLILKSFIELSSLLGFKGKSQLGVKKPEGDALLLGTHSTQKLSTTTESVKQAIGSVLIMDEVQSMFKPSSGTEDYLNSVKWLRTELTKSKYAKRMYVFALTGTPGGTVKDILSVINFVRPLNVPKIRPQDLNTHPEWLKGYISYVELRNDTSVYGVKNVKNVFAQMDPKYYAGYLRIIAGGKTTTVGGKEEDNVKLKKKITFSESLREDKKPGYMGLAIGAGDALTTKSALTGIYSKEELGNLMRRDMTGGIPAAIMAGPEGKKTPIVLSPKIRDCIKNVLTLKGKQYIYAINKSTIYTIMETLISLGYAGVTPKTLDASKTSPGKRFLYYKSGTYTFRGKIIKIGMTGEGSVKQLKGALDNPKNINGDYIKIVIASGTDYQGFDTPGLTGVHILDPLHDVASDIQALGRALRMCGHSKSASKNVTIYRYFSTVPRTFARDGVTKKQLPELEKIDKEIRRLNTEADFSMTNGRPQDRRLSEGINTFVFADAVRLNKAVAQTEQLLKAMAIDCPIYKDLFHSSENFRCGVPTKVDIEASKSPRSAKKMTPGGGLIQLSPLTPRSSSSKRSSSSRRSSSPTRRLAGVRSSSPRRTSMKRATSQRRALTAPVGMRTSPTSRSSTSSRSSGSFGSSSPSGVLRQSSSSSRK